MKLFWYFNEQKVYYEVSETKILVKSEKLDLSKIKNLIEDAHTIS